MKLQFVSLVFLETVGLTLASEDGTFLPLLIIIFLRIYPTKKPLSMAFEVAAGSQMLLRSSS